MSSLAVGRGPESELYWLGGLFTAAELAAADLLLKLRGDDEEEVAASADTSSYSRRFPSSRREDLAVVDEESKEERAFEDAATASAATPFSSRRSASSCCQVPVEAEEEPRPIVKETAPSLGSMELDRRARKRHRLLSELYAATAPVTSSSASAKKKIRKVHGDDGAGTVESSVDQETRNGEGLVAQKGFYVITP
ncbi:hypothetical protein CFC21_067090 [Triticum aestivum]|uniref:Uncharacterized protein n=4 Tax=Triticum TaxID=4564 RepID=A0A9R0WQU2_TRITD|nr:hypothetical protein CFC21_067090 [Triticum aestivum]VAI20553.1 unnamed protein product [Triticum turgidum subsp. durum]